MSDTHRSARPILSAVVEALPAKPDEKSARGQVCSRECGRACLCRLRSQCPRRESSRYRWYRSFLTCKPNTAGTRGQCSRTPVSGDSPLFPQLIPSPVQPFNNRHARETFKPLPLIHWLFHSMLPPHVGGYFLTGRSGSWGGRGQHPGAPRECAPGVALPRGGGNEGLPGGGWGP